jgi:hypothetical protein
MILQMILKHPSSIIKLIYLHEVDMISISSNCRQLKNFEPLANIIRVNATELYVYQTSQLL